MIASLPADVWDALELSAYAFGGIGAGEFWQHLPFSPLCIVGHAHWVAGDGEIADALCVAGISVSANDAAVRRINKRRHRAQTNRVSWAALTHELGVVRRDSA